LRSGRFIASHKAVIAVLLAAGLGVVYYFAEPSSVWMPKCPFRFLTGWECPACGSQRALHALLHGRFAEALGCNPFLVISIPYLSAVAYTTFRPGGRSGRLGYVQHPYVIRVYAAIFIFWWIFRNTPLWQ